MQRVAGYINKNIFFGYSVKYYEADFLRYGKIITKAVFVLALLFLSVAYQSYIKNTFFALNTSMHSQFIIKQVVVIGDRHLGNRQLMKIIGVDKITSLYKFNAIEARSKLIILPWVSDVEIEKCYPNRLEIIIKERKAYALYNNKGDIEVIDDKGVFMGPFDKQFIAAKKMPMVEGEVTALEALEFLNKLRKLNDLFASVNTCICFANNRWDLLLNNGVRIKLPSVAPIASLNNILKKGILQKLLSKNVKIIDLRNPIAISVILADKLKTQSEVNNAV